MMILIADCGSTKINWTLLNGKEKVAQIFTTGMNALLLTEEEMKEQIKRELMPHLTNYKVDEIYYYGAGIVSDEIKQQVVNALRANLVSAVKVEVASDLLAAARAVCGRKPGIACILGTGSNSCYYDGENVVQNVSPLGYILGDEGSGAVLGKLLVGDVLKKQLPQHLCDKFMKEYDLDYTTIITSVYRKPAANRFLAQFAPFLERGQLSRLQGVAVQLCGINRPVREGCPARGCPSTGHHHRHRHQRPHGGPGEVPLHSRVRPSLPVWHATSKV